MKCWGSNSWGQIGDGYTANREYAKNVLMAWAGNVLTGVSQISAGSLQNCVLMRGTSTVKCWGYNDRGLAGSDTSSPMTIYYPSDVLVSAGWAVLTGVSNVSAGYHHHCILMSSTGEVKCWGWNGYAQIGDGTVTASKLSPTSVQGVLCCLEWHRL